MKVHLLRTDGAIACTKKRGDYESSADINFVTCDECNRAHEAYEDYVTDYNMLVEQSHLLTRDECLLCGEKVGQENLFLGAKGDTEVWFCEECFNELQNDGYFCNCCCRLFKPEERGVYEENLCRECSEEFDRQDREHENCKHEKAVEANGIWSCPTCGRGRSTGRG